MVIWRTALLALLVSTAIPSFAANDCYDLSDVLGQWEGVRAEAVQAEPTYKKNMTGNTQKTMEKILKRWIKAGAPPGAIDEAGALRQAVTACYSRSLKMLLDHGVSPNTPLPGDSPLRMVSASLFCDERAAATVAKQLIDRGAIVNDRDALGQTALMRAALAGRGSIVNLLLDHGAALETADCARRTALHWAAAAGEPNAVKALLKRGANRSAKDIHGATPAQLTARFVQRPLPTNARYEQYQKAFNLLQSTATPPSAKKTR